MMLHWTSALVLLMCGLIVVCEGTKDCHRGTCGGVSYDIREAVCCGNSMSAGAGLSCCGEHAYNPANATCCKYRHRHQTAKVTDGVSEMVSACCGLHAYNPINEICCDSTVVHKSAPKVECCGKKAIDDDRQICCGPTGDKEILVRQSSRHLCCFKRQYDPETHCCPDVNLTLEIHPKTSPFCSKTPEILKKVGERTRGPQRNCTESQTSFCGSACYDPDEYGCCERNLLHSQRHHAPGYEAVPTVYDPRKQICCDGHVSGRKPWMDRCCGKKPYGLAQRGVLCCNNTLYTDRKDTEECSETGVLYDTAKGTTCCSRYHNSAGQHCCGTEVYQPDSEMCCNGHRHTRGENLHCCGIQTYDITDRQMKCCAGILHNLTLLGMPAHEAQCCGSVLQNRTEDVCCSSEDKEVLYSSKHGFSCCGHDHYNTSLWSCYAGRLRPVHHPGHHQNQMDKGCTLPSVNSLNERALCEGILIGTLESVSPHSIVFSGVVSVHGRNTTVMPLPSPHILRAHDCCSFRKLTPGKIYIIRGSSVFADFKHDSILRSIYLIMSACHQY